MKENFESEHGHVYQGLCDTGTCGKHLRALVGHQSLHLHTELYTRSHTTVCRQTVPEGLISSHITRSSIHSTLGTHILFFLHGVYGVLKVLSSIVHMKQADSAVSLTGSPGPSHSCSHSKIGAAKPTPMDLVQYFKFLPHLCA